MPYPRSTLPHQPSDVIIHPRMPANSVLKFRDAGGEQSLTVSGSQVLAARTADRIGALAEMRFQDSVGNFWPVLGTPHQQALHNLGQTLGFWDLGDENAPLAQRA